MPSLPKLFGSLDEFWSGTMNVPHNISPVENAQKHSPESHSITISTNSLDTTQVKQFHYKQKVKNYFLSISLSTLLFSTITLSLLIVIIFSYVFISTDRQSQRININTYLTNFTTVSVTNTTQHEAIIDSAPWIFSAVLDDSSLFTGSHISESTTLPQPQPRELTTTTIPHNTTITQILPVRCNIAEVTSIFYPLIFNILVWTLSCLATILTCYFRTKLVNPVDLIITNQIIHDYSSPHHPHRRAYTTAIIDDNNKSAHLTNSTTQKHSPPLFYPSVASQANTNKHVTNTAQSSTTPHPIKVHTSILYNLHPSPQFVHTTLGLTSSSSSSRSLPTTTSSASTQQTSTQPASTPNLVINTQQLQPQPQLQHDLILPLSILNKPSPPTLTVTTPTTATTTAITTPSAHTTSLPSKSLPPFSSAPPALMIDTTTPTFAQSIFYPPFPSKSSSQTPFPTISTAPPTRVFNFKTPKTHTTRVGSGSSKRKPLNPFTFNHNPTPHAQTTIRANTARNHLCNGPILSNEYNFDIPFPQPIPFLSHSLQSAAIERINSPEPFHRRNSTQSSTSHPQNYPTNSSKILSTSPRIAHSPDQATPAPQQPSQSSLLEKVSKVDFFNSHHFFALTTTLAVLFLISLLFLTIPNQNCIIALDGSQDDPFRTPNKNTHIHSSSDSPLDTSTLPTHPPAFQLVQGGTFQSFASLAMVFSILFQVLGIGVNVPALLIILVNAIMLHRKLKKQLGEEKS